jgi:predicted alpha-1,2-mannosidase
MNDYVDPFIGVDEPGNCLCGPYLPLSLVRLGPDTLAPQSSSGYSSRRPIVRFSHTHVSGTGGPGRYGNIGVLPFLGLPHFYPPGYEPSEEQAEPGYYSVKLEPDNIKVELTSTPRVGVHRYTFPANTSSAHVLIDLGAVIQVAGFNPNAAVQGEETTGASVGGFVEFVSEREVVGRADYQGGWGHNFPYSVYFYAVFDQPASQRRAANGFGTVAGLAASGPNCKALLTFSDLTRLNLRVGISYVSIAKARASVERETADYDFDMLRHKAANIWEKTLAKIRVGGGSEEQKTLFYTLFTRLLCMPSDLGVDDEHPLWHSGVRHFSDFYALWDSVRNANSLITLIDPELEVDLLNCLLDIAEHTGWLPDAWIAGHSAMIQGGSSADILFCEAALKELPGIDYGKALHYMRKNAEVEPPDPYLYGRYLREYRELGYLSTNVRKNSVSRHLEYTYQDWCIGRLADYLGQPTLAQRYFEDSAKVWNLWRSDLKSFAPKSPDGQWIEPFDQDRCWPDSWNDPYFYEGTGRQWSFSVQQDFAGLIERHGGKEAFIAHLDRFFDEGHYLSKETILHVPYLYIYAGRPDKTAERVRQCMARYFKASRDGLSDNEDMGCQSTWYICSAIGLYPVMGQDLYLLTTPVFKRIELQLGKSGKTLLIEAPEAGPDKAYIVNATLNGQPLDRAWLTHAEIANGATITYALSATPGEWATVEVPPSPLSPVVPVTKDLVIEIR